MVDWEHLTWDDLAPLYKDTWQGSDAVWVVLAGLLRPLGRACRNAMADERQTDHADVGELLQATLEHMVEALEKKHGMNRPSNWQAKSPRAVFLNWATSRAKDKMRAGRTHREDPLSESRDGPSADEKLARLVHQSPYRAERSSNDQRTAAKSELVMVREALEHPSLKPGQRLAWLCLRVPELLEARHADAAVVASRPGEGLARDNERTWSLLSRWADAVTEPDSRASRLELAWILFSTDERSPAAWKKDDSAACRDARDLLRQWDKRFRIALTKLLEET